MLAPVQEQTNGRPRTDEKRIKKWRQKVKREEWVYTLVESKRTFGEKEKISDALIQSTKSRLLLENRLYVLTDPTFLKLAHDLRQSALRLLKIKTNKTKLRIASMMPLLSLVSSIDYLGLLEEEEKVTKEGLALEEQFKKICKEKRQTVEVTPLPSTILAR